MYDELIKRLRKTSIDFGELDHVSVMMIEAADYIKKDDIIKWIDDRVAQCGNRYSADMMNMMDMFKTVVDNCLPFADVRPVVLCRDCKMASPCSDDREMYCTLNHCYKTTNYFCADGKKKNENPN